MTGICATTPFRDTAHGFLSWALATMVMVAVMGSIAGAAITGTVKAAGAVASGAAQVVGRAAGAVGGAASAVVTGTAGMVVGKATDQGSDLNYWISGLLRNGGPTDQQKQEIKDGAQDAVRKAQSATSDAREIPACRYCMRVSNERMELMPVVLSTKVLSASA